MKTLLRFPLLLLTLSSLAQVSTPQKSNDVPGDYSKEAFIIEKFHSRIDAADDGSNTRERTAEIKILADAGIKAFAVLTFPYTSSNEIVDVDYVRVRKPDGEVVKTPDYNIQDMPAEVTRVAPMYSDIHEKHIAVKGLAVGDVLEYRMRYRTLRPEVPGHFWFESNFIQDAIAKDERLEISIPTGKYVKVSSPKFNPEVREEGARRIYSWAHSNPSRPETREAPKRGLPQPSVQITTFRNWEEVGRWYGGLQKEAVAVTTEVQSKAAQITRGLKTDEEKVRAIYSFVSLQFHYIGLAFGIGRYQPHSANDVLGNGYGDCKDKHTLLASLLRATGYEAWPALIHSERKIDPEVPSPAQFNHVITVVSLGGNYVWLDTTAEVAPYGLLLAGLRDKQALVIPPDKAPVLMTTAKDPPVPQLQTFMSEGQLDANGTYTGHVEQSYRGDVEVVMRLLFRRVAQSQWKETLQRLSYGLGFGGDVSNVTVSSPEDMSQPFRLSYDYERKTYSEWENRRITPPLPAIGMESTKNSKKPNEAVLLGAYGEVRYQSKLSLPPGYSTTAAPNVDLVKPYAEYHATTNLQNGILTTSRRLVIKKNEIALADWEDYRDFGQAVSDDEYRYIYLNGEDAGASRVQPTNIDELDNTFREGNAALQRRDFSQAEELYRKVIAGNSRYHGAHYNLALALAGSRRMDEAVGELRKEEEITPDDPKSYDALAGYLMMQGRPDEAAEEWRKLLKVDPKNHDAALKLSTALVLQHKNADALAVLEDAAKKSPDSPSLEMALGQLYVRAGQAEKGVPHLQNAIEKGLGPSGINPGMLNDAAWALAEKNTHLELAKEYAEKAIAQLEDISETSEDSDEALRFSFQFPALWDTLGWVYFQQGDTARAEDFILPAWVQGQRSSIGDHLGQVYERAGKKKEAAKAYEQALVAQSATAPYGGLAVQQTEYRKQHEEIVARYEKLTGQKHSERIEVRRLPNGEWSKMPAEELQDSQRVKMGPTTKVTGTALFTVVFTPGKVESVRFRSGDGQLQSIGEQLKVVKFPMPFPPGSGAKIPRLVKLSCASGSECTAEFVSRTQVMAGAY